VWWLSTDVSGQPIGPQLQESSGHLTLKDDTDRLFRNVGASPTYDA
jgi:hypothetical protein